MRKTCFSFFKTALTERFSYILAKADRVNGLAYAVVCSSVSNVGALGVNS